jgi:hypothetical protein
MGSTLYLPPWISVFNLNHALGNPAYSHGNLDIAEGRYHIKM